MCKTRGCGVNNCKAAALLLSRGVFRFLESDRQAHAKAEIRDISSHAELPHDVEQHIAAQHRADAKLERAKDHIRVRYRLSVQARYARETQIQTPVHGYIRAGR